MNGKPYTQKEWADIIEMVKQGATYKEIAEMTGRKQTTLRSIYSRGLDKLREMLRS